MKRNWKNFKLDPNRGDERMSEIEITSTKKGFLLKICGVEFGDITEMVNISIMNPLESEIEIKCNLKEFIERMRAIKDSQVNE